MLQLLQIATTQPSGGFFQSAAGAAIIGAIVGGLFALIGGIYPYWRSVGHERKKAAAQLRAWRTGLKAELEHILGVIQDARTQLQSALDYSKRLNSDFLEATRFKWCELDQQEQFLKCLSEAYRDIVHTNGRLDHLEQTLKGCPPTNIKVQDAHSVAIASLNGVAKSVTVLKDVLEKKLRA